MNKKLFKALAERCKDMGLTDKAIKEFAERASEGLAEDATDEDIEKAVDSVAAFARITQGEITRKTRKTHNQPTDEGGNATDPKGEGGDNDLQVTIQNMLDKQLGGINAKLAALEKENEQLKAEKAASERSGVIAAKAKELGIPDFLVRHLAIAEDADIDKALAEIKQDLVNGSLLPKDVAAETGKPAEQLKADAMSWAESLPNV